MGVGVDVGGSRSGCVSEDGSKSVLTEIVLTESCKKGLYWGYL